MGLVCALNNMSLHTIVLNYAAEFFYLIICGMGLCAMFRTILPKGCILRRVCNLVVHWCDDIFSSFHDVHSDRDVLREHVPQNPKQRWPSSTGAAAKRTGGGGRANPMRRWKANQGQAYWKKKN